jgi:hypothetical protein
MAFNATKKNAIISFSLNATTNAVQCPSNTLVDGLTVTAPASNTASVFIGGAPISAGGPLQLATYTVATLPACTASDVNSLLAVTDATAPTYNGALIGGGTVHVPVFCDGSVWTSH